MTARRLADILGTSTRTIYRDINALSLAHIPVAMDYGPGGGYYLPDDYHLESAIFTREEAVSLVLSADISGNYSLFAGDDGLQRALIKLEAALPEEYRADVRAAREHILLDTTAWYCQQQAVSTLTYLETIRSAVLHAHQLDILYSCHACKGMQGACWRRVEPYGLVFKGLLRPYMRTGLWYLVAFCQLCHAYQTFRVSAIENVHSRREQITVPPDFDLQSYWQKARQLIDRPKQSLQLILRVAPSARRLLHGSYTVLDEEQDGSMTIQLELESEEAAVSYVLALGADATVLSPPEVRRAISATAHAIAEMYEQC